MIFARLRQYVPLPNTYFHGPTRVQISNGISIGSAILQNVPILSLPLKIAPSHGVWTSILYVVPWPHLSPQPGRHFDRFSRFCTAHYCVRQTDRPRHTRSVITGNKFDIYRSPHLCFCGTRRRCK